MTFYYLSFNILLPINFLCNLKKLIVGYFLYIVIYECTIVLISWNRFLTIKGYVGYGFSIHFLNITFFFNWNGL